MHVSIPGSFFLILTVSFFSCGKEPSQQATSANPEAVMVRIAEIEVDSAYFEEYIAILKEEAAKSVLLEEGVLCIYPMYQKENPTSIRLLEIYSDEDAYHSHLKTEHFLHYKTQTVNMIRSLTLVDMYPIDPGTMSKIFKKL